MVQTSQFLRQVTLFAPLDDDLRGAIAAQSRPVTLPAGQWLFRQGDVGDALYVVRTGRLEVVVEGSSSSRVVNVLKRGAVLGELALVTDEPRVASVRAVRDSELLAVDRAQFEHLLETNGPFALALTKSLASLLQAGTKPQRHGTQHGVLTLLPHGPVPRVQEIAGIVERELARTRTVATVSTFSPPSGGETPAQMLDRAEEECDHVLLVGSSPEDRAAGSGEWTEFCVRQADRVVVLATAGTPPPSEEQASLRGCDVAIVGRRPTAQELAPWLDQAQARAVHWVPDDARHDAAVERLTRRITNQSLGVVLSGGGARGLAHIGAVQALEEHGLALDRFGGTSFGAFVGALYASGLSTDEVMSLCRREFVERRPFSDYTVPRVSLLRGKRAFSVLKRLFGPAQIEELPLSWYSVSADLLNAEAVIHRRGPVADAVMASASLPGLAPPRVSADRILVDGGVLNNLPIDAMADTGEGPVVAIDVMKRWGDHWQQRQRQRRRRDRWFTSTSDDGMPPPTIAETISAVSSLGSRQLAERTRGQAALTVVPDLADFELLDWKRLEEIVEAGRRATVAALEAMPGDALGQGGADHDLIANTGP